MIRVNTNECRGSYTCIRHCPSKAIAARLGRAEVIDERCVACGVCIQKCGRGAIEMESMLPRVLEYLDGPVETVLVLDCCFPVAFPGLSAHKLVAAARHLGFGRVVEGAFGVDLIAPVYQELFAQPDNTMMISTACPAAYRYVCRFAPSLVPFLAPVVSPMIAVGRYLRAENGGPRHIVYASGCPAYQREMTDPDVAGIIDAVITLEELRGMFSSQGIIRDLLREEPFDEPHPVIGRWYPIAGARSWILGANPQLSPDEAAFFIRAEDCVQGLRDLAASDLYVRFVEVCFCERGIDGPFVSRDLGSLAKRQIVAEYALQEGGRVEHARRSGVLKRTYEIDLGRAFVANDLRLRIPSDGEVYTALDRLDRHTKEDCLNCGACGYDTCWEGGVALVLGLADENMCLPHVIEKCRRTSLALQRANRKLEAAQRQLIQSEKLAAMGQLAAGVAHEINNPLGTVLIYGHLLEDQMEKDDPRSADARIIVSETERCRKIVSGLLNFARQSKLHLLSTDMPKLLEDTAREAEAQFPGHTVEIIRKSDPDLPRIELDPDQMKQVLINIIVNSLEVMPNGGTLTLEARMSADRNTMRVGITDTGPGISEENQAKLFQPFFTTKPIGKGTGLGLPIAYGIIKMHRGGISVHSRLGKGTTFTLTLPMKQEASPEQAITEELLGGPAAPGTGPAT
jgi:two-component system NtrC family sensor kinase